MLGQLPNEILHNILLRISYRDLNILRQTSRNMRAFCDCPIYWENIILQSKENKLWELSTLKSIIGLHLDHIKSIEIQRGRDSVIRYLLKNCINLQYLTIHGWVTLSDHSLRLYSQQNLSLKNLSLFGSPNKSNYISVDAYALGNLITQSPNITHVLILCQVHIHAEPFISLLEKANKKLPLVSFTVASNRTWRSEHILRLTKVCPDIQRICLLPEAANAGISSENHFEQWLHERIGTFPSNTSFIATADCIIYIKASQFKECF